MKKDWKPFAMWASTGIYNYMPEDGKGADEDLLCMPSTFHPFISMHLPRPAYAVAYSYEP
jgi:hypothetical protein